MSVREKLNNASPAAKISVITVFAIAVGLSLWASLSSGRPPNATRAYYSSDDGQTYFVDDFFKSYPFDHDGQQAYRAYMFQDPTGKKFVGYLERYRTEGIKQLDDLLARGGMTQEQLRGAIQPLRSEYTEVKKPNDPKAKWYRAGSAQAEGVASGRAPDGSYGNVILVFP